MSPWTGIPIFAKISGLLWEDVIQDRQVAENEDEIDDVVDQDDPYDDNLPQAEWEELFNGIHADDI